MKNYTIKYFMKFTKMFGNIHFLFLIYCIFIDGCCYHFIEVYPMDAIEGKNVEMYTLTPIKEDKRSGR